MVETVRRADDLVRTIAKLQRRVDSLPTHEHTTHVERLTRTTTQLVTTGGAATPFNPMGNTAFGGSPLWDSPSSNHSFTFNAAGVYLVAFGVGWQSDSTGQRRTEIVTTGVGGVRDRRLAVTGAESFIQCRIEAAAGDTFQCEVFQNSGVTLTIAANELYTFIEVELVGRL